MRCRASSALGDQKEVEEAAITLSWLANRRLKGQIVGQVDREADRYHVGQSPRSSRFAGDRIGGKIGARADS